MTLDELYHMVSFSVERVDEGFSVWTREDAITIMKALERMKKTGKQKLLVDENGRITPLPMQQVEEIRNQEDGKKMELKKVELEGTISLMTSEDWRDRFVAEYLQTKIRYEKLHRMIVKREAGKLEFETPIPLESWKAQAQHMGMYLYELEKQAVIHGIMIPGVTI